MNASPAPDRPPRTTAAVRIATGARLHFGLLDTAPPFGGVGVMIDGPATEIEVALADKFSCDASIRPRVTDIARRAAELAGIDGLPPCRVTAIRLAPAHHGLGSGTQLSLAIAEGLCRVMKIRIDPHDLAVDIAARGKRSAIGVHGYFGGGLIYEDAPEPISPVPISPVPISPEPISPVPMPLNPIRSRIELPDAWRVVVMRPDAPTPTVSGTSEVDQFAALGRASLRQQTQLREMIETEIMPAASAGSFDDFSGAIARYNHAAGMLFADVQGGPYHGPAVTGLIDRLSHDGVRGVGQSSWGPGVFAWFASPSDAKHFTASIDNSITVLAIAKPSPQGRRLTE